MPMNGTALAGLGGGVLFLYAAIKGKSILAIIPALIKGESPSKIAATNTISTALTPAPGSGTKPPIGAVIGAVTGSGGSAGSSVASYQQYAFSQFPKYGWGTDQQQPLIQLWNKESGWNPHAQFPGQITSDPMATGQAYGIPQALPPDKMASAGSDWINNPATQIDWGLGYISGTYVNPAGAWAHEVANNWY